jgi:hypothetical protein
MCGPSGNISKLLEWKVVSGVESAAMVLSDYHAINSGIRLRLHASHPNYFYYAGYSPPQRPAFSDLIKNLRELLVTPQPPTFSDLIKNLRELLVARLSNHCWSTFTHFEDHGMVAAVVIQTDEKVISCCTWAYNAIGIEEQRLRTFVRSCLAQIMEKTNPPNIAFSGDTTGWKCKIFNHTAPNLSAAYVQCSDCIVTCSTSILRWFWQRKDTTRVFYADLYLEISYTHLAQMVMAEVRADCHREYSVRVTAPSQEKGMSERLLLERIFRGKAVYENVDPEDGGDTICILCQDKLLATESRLFYSCLCDTTIKSKGGIHASCLLSGLLLQDTFPVSLRLKKTKNICADMKCNNCKESLTGNLVCMLPYRVGKNLYFDIQRQKMLNYIDKTGDGGTKTTRRPFLWKRYHKTKELLLRTIRFCPDEKKNLFQIDGAILPNPQPLESIDDPVPEGDDDTENSDETFPLGQVDFDSDSEPEPDNNDVVSVNSSVSNNDVESANSSDSSIVAVDAGFPLNSSNHDERAILTLSTMSSDTDDKERKGLQIAFSSCVQTTRSNNHVVLPINHSSFSRLRRVPVVGDFRSESFWYNDEIINHYMILLSKRDEEIHRPQRKSYYMDPLSSCDFLEWTRTQCASALAKLKRRFLSLEERNKEEKNPMVYPMVGGNRSYSYTRWMPVNDLRQLDYIFMPIKLEDAHFVLGFIHVKKKTTYVFDSLGRERKKLSFSLSKLVEQLLGGDANHPLAVPELGGNANHPLEVTDKWSWVRNSYSPKQTNMCDCGMYVCLIANFISIGLGTSNIDNTNAECYRERVAIEIYNGKVT